MASNFDATRWFEQRREILEALMGQPEFWERPDALDIAHEHVGVLRVLEPERP